RIPSHPVFMPPLDKAINLLIERAPLDPEQAAHLLVAEGISSRPFDPQSLCSVAKACGRNLPFEIEEHRGRSRIVTKSHAKHANSIISIAYRQAGASGATNIAEVTAEATSNNIEITEKEVREILQLFSDVQFLEDEWFWYPKLKDNRNRLRNISRKML